MCRDGQINVIVLYVSDLGHKKEAHTSDIYVRLPTLQEEEEKWSKITGSAPALTTKDMLKYGRMAERKPGLEPK